MARPRTARPGPRPRPTRLKVLTGDRSVNDREPAPAPGPVEAPDDLDRDQRAAFDDIVRAVPGGVITASDTIGLTVFAHRLAEFRAAAALAATVGPLVRDEKGLPRVNPAVRVAREAGRDVLRWSAEFGMTPSSRSLLVDPRHAGAAEIAGRYINPPT
jgi:P27 family predicted phage terminase small subunit